MFPIDRINYMNAQFTCYLFTQSFRRIKVKSFSNLNIMHTVLSLWDTYMYIFSVLFKKQMITDLHHTACEHAVLLVYVYYFHFLIQASIGADCSFFVTILLLLFWPLSRQKKLVVCRVSLLFSPVFSVQSRHVYNHAFGQVFSHVFSHISVTIDFFLSSPDFFLIHIYLKTCRSYIYSAR